MKLRTRFAVTLALLVIPFAVAVTLYQLAHHERVVREAVTDQLQDRMGARERALCEARPDTWPGLGRRRRQDRVRRFGSLYAYGPNFVSKNPSAPRFPSELREELRNQGSASRRASGGVDVAVRMADTGPCAVILLRRTAPMGRRLAQPWFPALLVTLGALILAVFAAAPVVARIRKLTDLVLSEGDLEEMKGSDEVAELAAAFSQKRSLLRERMDQVEQQGKTLRDYLADTAHDVMIPVTVLQGHLSALRRAVEDGRVPEKERLQEAIEECHYLASVLRNLNVTAKLEATPDGVGTERVDLVSLVERVVARHKPLAQSASVGLEFGVPEGALETTGDVTLLEQAIGNLVHNGIRYNHQDGHVAVVLDRDGDDFLLSVTDDGPGLPEEDLKRVTDRGFRSARGRQRHPSGLGLGLYIAQDVASRHGHELTFKVPQEGGLRVELRGALVGKDT